MRGEVVAKQVEIAIVDPNSDSIERISRLPRHIDNSRH